MVKVVSQETFDSAVKENIEIFSMEPEEALKEAIEQFTSQGVDLTNIVKSLDMVLGKVPIESLVEKLRNCKIHVDEMSQCLNELKEFVSKDISYRLLAGKLDLYPVLLQILKENEDNDQRTIDCLECVTFLMDGYPDLLDSEGIDYIIKTLNSRINVTVIIKTFTWVRICSLKHEKNRQEFMDRNMAELIAQHLKEEPKDLTRAVCLTISALTYDDDIREVISEAHRHAVTLAGVLLKPLVQLIKEVKGDPSILSEVFLAVSSLIVRNEYCEIAEKEGIVGDILDALAAYPKNEKISRRSLLLIACLAGNDEVKRKIIMSGAAPLITSMIALNMSSAELMIIACNTLTRLCLRSSSNSSEFFQLGCGDLIFQLMKMHSTNYKLLMSCCRALRNLGSHNPEIKLALINLGLEELLNEIIEKQPICASDAKQVLKEFGCSVALNEPWTGKQGDKLAI